MAKDAHVTPTIVASSTNWATYKAGGLKAILDGLVTANAAKANPVVGDKATVAISTATGTLPAGDYFASYTYVDAFGETTVGASRSEAFTVVGLTELATVTLPAKPTGVQSMNLYITPTNGVAGTETLYATGITGTTFACNVVASADMSGAGIPATNTTGAAGHTKEIYAILPNGASELVLGRISESLSNYLRGDPISRNAIMMQPLAWVGITKLWYTALSEIAVLIAANMPTTSTRVVDGRGLPQIKWTIP